MSKPRVWSTYLSSTGKKNETSESSDKDEIPNMSDTPDFDSPASLMEIDGDTYAAGTKINATNSTEGDSATHNANNSTLDIKGSGSGTINLGGDELPGGSSIHETNQSEGDGAMHEESHSSLEVN